MALDLNIIVGICKFHKKKEREPTVKCEEIWDREKGAIYYVMHFKSC